MKILVTGGAGYIGSHTCKALARAGHTPITFDNLSTGHRQSVKWGPLIEGDLADQALLGRVLRDHEIEAVVHFAASAYVGESVKHPQKYFRNNVVNSLNLLDAMLGAGVDRVVFSSSCAVYGVPDSLPISEDHPTRPISPYGESKLFVENALRWYETAYGLKWIALRYFNAAGADPDGELGEDHDPETHLIPLVVSAARNGHAVEVYGTHYSTADGTAVRDYVHVTDLANAHAHAVAAIMAGRAEGVFNLGIGRGFSVHDVIAAVGRVAGREIRSQGAEARPGDPATLVADPAKARDVLGWRPRHTDLDAIVADASRWASRPSAGVVP